MSAVVDDTIAAGGDAPRLHPIGLVARKEWTELKRDARWRVLLAVTLLLMAAALALGLQRTHHLSGAHDQAAAGDRQVWGFRGLVQGGL